jgi:lipopolysaccharide transport system permease protein
MVGFNFSVRLVLMACVMLVWGIAPSESIVAFPIAAIALIGAGFMVGLLIAPLANLYGDMGRAIPVIMPFWMLLTPVVYPARTTGLAGWLATWNPVSPLLTTARESLTSQSFSLLPEFVIVAGFILPGILIGLLGFRVFMPHLIARMGN